MIRFFSYSILICILFIQCKKDKGPAAPPPWNVPPTIQTVQLTDYCAGTVTITGSNFDTVVTRDSIFFGDIKGIIHSVTRQQVIATLPVTTFSGVVTFYNSRFPTTSIDSIHRDITTIDSISPSTAGTGTIISIYGHFFNPDQNADTVYFNNIPATVLSANNNTITATVPVGATTGKVSIRSNCRSAISPGNFTNVNKGTVYTGTNGAYFFAIDITSGAPKWTFPMKGGGSNSPAYANGILYIGEGYDSSFYALDATTGKQVWKFKATAWDGTPLVSNGVVYMGCTDGYFYALNAATGQKIWAYNSGYTIQSSPTLYNGNLYSPNDNGFFYSINAGAGTLNWKRHIFSGGNPSAVNGYIYTSGYDTTGEISELYALDAGTGATVWTFPIYELSGSSPTVVDGVLYIGSGGGEFYAIDAVTGTQIWNTSGVPTYSASLVVNNMIYITGYGGSLSALDAASGTSQWLVRLDPSGLFPGSPVVANGIVYAGGSGGNLYAIDATSGQLVWKTSTSGYPILSSPLVVDQNGNVFRPGSSGEVQ